MIEDDFKKDLTEIEVFVTKEARFRASVKEPGRPQYEVTLGGEEWKEGKGRRHAEEIYKKVARIVGKLLEEMDKIS